VKFFLPFFLASNLTFCLAFFLAFGPRHAPQHPELAIWLTTLCRKKTGVMAASKGRRMEGRKAGREGGRKERRGSCTFVKIWRPSPGRRGTNMNPTSTRPKQLNPGIFRVPYYSLVVLWNFMVKFLWFLVQMFPSLRSPRCPKRWITARWIPWGYTVLGGDLSDMVRILEIIPQHGTY
jgi:hypothetical protein